MEAVVQDLLYRTRVLSEVGLTSSEGLHYPCL